MDKEDSNEGGGDGVQPEKPKDTESKAELLEVKEDSQDGTGDKASPGAGESPSEAK